MGVYLHLKQGNAVEQRVKRAQRAQPFAERPPEQHAEKNHGGQHSRLPGEQCAERRANAGVHQGERDRALEDSLRTQVFAEDRVAHAELVHQNGRQQHYHHEQHGVLEIPQRLQPFGGQLRGGDMVQQLLKPAERAEKAADEPSEQHAQQDQQAGDVIAEAEAGRADDCLKRADGARARRARAGIAVQSGHTDPLAVALIQSAGKEIRQVDVGEQGGGGLYRAAQADEQGERSFTQCRRTPCTGVSPWITRRRPHHARRRTGPSRRRAAAGGPASLFCCVT